MHPARPMTIDFTKVPTIRMHSSGNVIHAGDGRIDLRARDVDGKLLTHKQIRARARRAGKRRRFSNKAVMTQLEFETLYKPIEEWDLEELARGRPRSAEGTFSGAKPKWITREIHERALERFKSAIKIDMGAQAITALDTIQWILSNDQVDERGKPLVAASTKLDASKFIVEHLVGKPKQHIEADISVKLQAILGDVMVNAVPTVDPATGESYGALPAGEDGVQWSLAHYPGETMELSGSDDIVDGEVIDDEEDDE